jgi:hypothetical protein
MWKSQLKDGVPNDAVVLDLSADIENGEVILNDAINLIDDKLLSIMKIFSN